MIGLGVMIHALSGGNPNEPSKYVGRVIRIARLDQEINRYIIEFQDETRIEIWDNGQSCCELRYMTTDDENSNIIGHTLLSITSKDGPNLDDDGDHHDTCFVEIQTSGGLLTLTNHNEHNGYYGGFGLEITEFPGG